jgi:hypothetical protein
MRTSKDPLAPIRNWKELFLGERNTKKVSRPRRRSLTLGFGDVSHAHAGE